MRRVNNREYSVSKKGGVRGEKNRMKRKKKERRSVQKWGIYWKFVE